MRSFIFYICGMRSKLHFGILIILLAFLGRYIETSVAPNQQIVVQFSDAEITENDAHKTIEAIQLKLQAIGVERIQIGQDQNGQLKITYYSNADVEQIQSILSDDTSFNIAHNSNKDHSNNLPKHNNLKDYQLNISEIQESGQPTHWDFEGVEVVELNQKSDRFNNLKVDTSFPNIEMELTNLWVKVALRTNITTTLLVDNHSYKIPEVRAGPIA